MAPSFDTLSEHDLHEEEDEEVDFSGECDVVFGAVDGPSLLTFRVPHCRSEGAVRSETRGGLGYICGHRWFTSGS